MAVEHQRTYLKPVALVVALVALMVIAKSLGLGDRLGQLRDWIESLGAFGPVAFCILYIAAVIAMIPGFAITVAAGAIFGAVWGSVYVSISSTFGAATRYLARDSVSTWLSRSPKFKHLDNMTEQHGAIFVAITRLVPLFPFNLLNYGFGLTKVKFTTYVLWSWMCMLPGTVIYVVGTDAFVTTLREGKIPWALMGALAVVVVLTFFVVKTARRRLKQAEATNAKTDVTSQATAA
jgi:uncharacterized membrane protein YdjX (TVP38/TMEM64 family)